VSKIATICTGTALVAVLAFQQAEIEVVHDEVRDIRAYIIKTDLRMTYTRAEEECLAKNIYHEAGVEPVIGKFAVAQVTLNRLRDGRWGQTICKVVYAPSQFSWTMYNKQRYSQPRGPLWDQSREVARSVLAEGYRVKGLEDSTYYHADYIKPPLWAKSVAKIQQIGQHIFYKKT
jgi:spore germination cell wall hydrolase CwlJ-like protein